MIQFMNLHRQPTEQQNETEAVRFELEKLKIKVVEVKEEKEER